ncbi:hypothetical protein [Rhizorhapis sp.]|uniref:hypothetical protein n=1 Tax=Rhizorhapis sp. TaxID=1968842 RepID=UPI002B46AAD0|nr:hypothetical protein [Rhizorhapis sp.]HKR17111.1 hypothetical protein [Rhizorhapis sp.]
MEIHEADAEMRAAHAAIGGFIARCSLLDYRVSQFVARWFCTQEKQKFLSYTLKAMPFAEKRQVIEERLVNWHNDAQALRDAMAEISAVLERRNLVANGVLSRRSSGALCIKSFSAARFISEEGAIDIIEIAELPIWSERASELSERLIAVGLGLRDAAH